MVFIPDRAGICFARYLVSRSICLRLRSGILDSRFESFSRGSLEDPNGLGHVVGFGTVGDRESFALGPEVMNPSHSRLPFPRYLSLQEARKTSRTRSLASKSQVGSSPEQGSSSARPAIPGSHFARHPTLDPCIRLVVSYTHLTLPTNREV